MKFTKMHGLGNDFVVVDAINQRIALTPKKIRFMANRHTGIGFDQLLVVEKTSQEHGEQRRGQRRGQRQGQRRE